MSRNSSGTYSLPAGNPVVTGTTITSTWANTTMSDLATAMTDSLSRSGLGSMLAGLELFDGTSSLPGLSWGTELTSGLYRAGASDYRWVNATTELLQLTTSLVRISGTEPIIRINETDAAADNKLWEIRVVGEDLQFNVQNDALGRATWATVTRTGATVDSIALASTTLSVSGVATFSAAGSGVINAGTIFSSARPSIRLSETDAAANNQNWLIDPNGEALNLYVVNDAGSTAIAFFTVERTGTTVDSIALAATTLSFTGNVSTPNTSESEVGYKGIPDNSQSGNYELVLADAGTDIVHPSGGGAGDTFTIPANASVAFPVGTVISITNLDSNSISIAITSDTLTLAGTTSTGTRTLAQNGVATIKKTSSTGWLIYGVALS